MSGSGADFVDTVDVTFHNIPYLLTISTINGDTLCVEAEQRSDSSRWRGDFTNRYIEDITNKTGNFKKFGVFVKMLLSALKQQSDSVFVDLLTYQDLEVLKNRRANGSSGAAPAAAGRTIAPSNKRYLILTYAAEFDRVHYPLPLLYDENPDPEALKATISRLRAELEQAQAAGGASGRGGGRRGAGSETGGAAGDVVAAAELRRLREENTGLRQTCRQLEQAGARGGGGDEDSRDIARELKAVRKERDLLLLRADAADAELERERGLHRRELRRRAKDSQESEEELGRARATVRDLMLRVRQLQEELDSGRRNNSSSVDRTRNAYGQIARGTGAASTSRPTSSSRRLPPMGSAYAPRPESRSRDPEPRPRSRPNSAPVKARFDPTAYVNQKREARQSAERGRSGGSSRAPTPPQSYSGGGGGYTSSGRSSPLAAGGGGRASSRPTSGNERARGLSPAGSRPTSSERRPTSGTERLPRPMSNGRGGPAGPSGRSQPEPPQQQGRQAWGGSPGSSSRGRAAWGTDANAWSKYPQGAANGGRRSTGGSSGGGGDQGPGPTTERASSPGRALQEVKRKLSEYVQKRSTGPEDAHAARGPLRASSGALQPTASGGGAALSGASSKAGLFDDSSAEIADIDGRLHALQNFLRLAKSSTSAGSAAS